MPEAPPPSDADARASRPTDDDAPSPGGDARGDAPARGELASPERLAQLGELAESHTARRHAEIQGMLEIMASKRRLFTINFLAGLSRGIGFFLGVTLVGGMLIGALALAFDFTASSLGWKELRFSSLVQGFAQKYKEAERVWRSVEEEEGDEPVDPEAEEGSPDDAAPIPEPPPERK